ncbi:MAG: hypothetical protein DLM69_05835, partial [Candidatus Chloroheliales bacterium]
MDNKLITSVTPEAQAAPQTHEQEQSYLKFFVAAAIFLLVSGLHALIWRLPAVEQWVRGADYGGRMATTLSQTHITVVAFGTITITGLMYYLLPRILGVPLASRTLATVSFWCTAFGVFAFYLALVIMGIWEGNLVHQGYTYFAARFALDGWHQGLLGFAASIMGIGYWTFIWNVISTARAGVHRREAIAADPLPASPGGGGALSLLPSGGALSPLPSGGAGGGSVMRNLIGLGSPVPKGGGEYYYIAKFMVAAAVGLFIGTVQGVIQVLPFFVDWKDKTGTAGDLIDPISHAHINLVGGVVFAMMGFSYYFVPRIVGKPIHSVRLANLSFRFLLVGVFGFYLTLLTLGFIEGNMVVSRGITPAQARDAVGVFHPLFEAFFAALMGLGFWTYIANIFLTLADKRAANADKPEYEWLTPIIGLSCFGLLCGTIQGVIQTLPWSVDWLDAAGDAGEFITPLAHAQLNIIAGVVLSLTAFSFYLIPQIGGRKLFSNTLAKTSLYTILGGAALMYLGFIVLGAGMGPLVQQGDSFAQARAIFPGNFWYYALLITGPSVVGLGYFMYSANIFATVGRTTTATWFGRMMLAFGRSISELVTIYRKAMPRRLAQARPRALTASAVELALPGAGWFISGRPKMGAVLLLTFTGIMFSTVMVVFVMYDRVADIPFLQVIIGYFVFNIISSLVQYFTYMAQVRAHFANRDRL